MTAGRRRTSGWDLGLLPRARARRRIHAVYRLLAEHAGEPERRPLEDPVDELVLTVLSQNTNDGLRDQAFEKLKTRFPTWQDVVRAPTKSVAKAIKIGGLSNVKSGRIQKLLATIQDRHGGFDLRHLREMSTEEAHAELVQFTGVGPKTVACVLVFACGHDVFPVDTHILRISKRLGLIPERLSLERAHDFWAAACPPGKAYELHLMLIRHGRTICHARGPACAACPIRRHCAYAANSGA